MEWAREDGPSGKGDITLGGFLLTSNRLNLQVCVDSVDVDSALAVQAAEAIEASWPTVMAHELWSSVASEYTDPQVSTSCPGSPIISHTRRAVVESPSIYRVHVYVAPPELIASSPELRTARLTSEENFCFDDDCSQVTTGLYIQPEEITNANLVAAYAIQALTLEPPGPIYVPDESATPAASATAAPSMPATDVPSTPTPAAQP